MTFIEKIRTKAKKANKKIVFPEGNEPRVLQAASFLTQNEILKCVLLGDEDEIRTVSGNHDVQINQVEVLNPQNSGDFDNYCDLYFDLRKDKGASREQCYNTMKTTLNYGAMMVRTGKCDGLVAGSIFTTGDVLRASIQIIGMEADVSLVSSTFEMVWPEKVLTYADCAVVPKPDANQLADIAISSAKTHQTLTGDEPVVALLSYSTKGSAQHEIVEQIKQAVSIAKSKEPDLQIDGELQVDAALVESVAKRKAPQSEVAGKANVLIFPDLNAGNIAYKLTERLAGAQAIGPILQGLAKPANDLSRGCTWEDVVNVACISALRN